jgi:hypothetical protein
VDAVYHQATQRFITLGPATNGDFGIVTLNGTSGHQLAFTPLKLPFSDNNTPMNLQIDQSTGDLYGFNLASSHDDPSGGSAGVYRIDAKTGEPTLVATAGTEQWEITSELSAFDSKTHSYVFWGNDLVRGCGIVPPVPLVFPLQPLAAFRVFLLLVSFFITDPLGDPLFPLEQANNFMGVADCAAKSVTPIRAIPIKWSGDDLAFALWDPETASSILSLNQTSQRFIRVDVATGDVTDIADVAAVMPGIPSQQAAAYDAKTKSVFQVFVDFTKNPSQYQVMSGDISTGNITRLVPTEGNMDFAFVFVQ